MPGVGDDGGGELTLPPNLDTPVDARDKILTLSIQPFNRCIICRIRVTCGIA